MKILVVSDTHRENRNFLKALEIEGPVDALIHCGDVEGSEYLYESSIDGPVYIVSGNNDFFSDLDSEIEFEICGYKALLVHGHQYRVSVGDEMLRSEAMERGVDLLFYGHIHRPVVDYDGRMYVINPGSLTYPRQEGHLPSYVVINIDDKDDIFVEVKYIR